MIEEFRDIEYMFYQKIGLEVGGPSEFFKELIPIYNKVLRLDGVNFSSNTIWTGEIDVSKGFVIDGKKYGNQYISDVVDLSSINQKYDFIISCNSIEHVANPLKAIKQSLSILKENGILVIVAPRKESNFDHNRQVVKFEHIVNDYDNNISENDFTHLDEILKLHDLSMDGAAGNTEQFKERSLKNFENRCLHQHVFDLGVLQKMFLYSNLQIIKSIEIYTDYVIIGRKNEIL
jgi:SAM-dependent methyltransferase